MFMHILNQSSKTKSQIIPNFNIKSKAALEFLIGIYLNFELCFLSLYKNLFQNYQQEHYACRSS